MLDMNAPLSEQLNQSADQIIDALAERIVQQFTYQLKKVKQPAPQKQPSPYYSTKDVAAMFNVDPRRVGDACRFKPFPDYVKFYKNKGSRGRGDQFEKPGIDRLLKEDPHFFRPFDTSNGINDKEARE